MFRQGQNAEAKAKDGNKYEMYDYPGYHAQHKNGNDRSKMNLERITVFQETITGEGSVPQFSAGKVFTLEDHDIDDFNADYIIESVIHKGYQPQVLQELADTSESSSFTNSFVALPDKTTFRPPKEFAKPVVQGVQTAIVTGPEGEEIYTDEFGRVKVRFHWDRVDKDKAATSCWIRVGQAWTGSSWGSMSVPRIGQEVIVSFIEGDPDRPVITGRVYHADNYRPYALPANKTKTVFKTNSTPGGGGYNELSFEDKKGNEEVFIHAEKDMETVVENDDTQMIKRDRLINVLQHHTETITGETIITMLCSLLETIGMDETRTVGNNFTETIGVDSTRDIGNNEKKSVGVDTEISIGNDLTEDVGNDETKSVSNDQTINVGNDLTEDIGNDQTINIGNDTTETIGNDSTMTITNDSTLNIGNDSTIDIGNDANYAAANNLTADVGNDVNYTVGNNVTADVATALNATAGDAISVTSSGGDITINAGAATITLANNGDITIDGANITINASGDLTAAGSAIGLN
ncbi:MAG: type VI secretion system tip protein VgrG [Deltaproteobacteria bacterium]|nr:type VI secretion system tip protein VgrG [Deltaproteobacteria bacterium]